MLKDELPKMILQAMKEKDSVKTLVYREIKTKFKEFETAVNAKPLDSAAEVGILKKIYKTRQESIETYKAAGRSDLAQNEENELNVLSELLPKEPTAQEILDVMQIFCSEKYNLDYVAIQKKDMGNVIKFVKSRLPGVDGKTLSDIVKECLV